MRRVLLIITGIMLLAGCRQTQPQRPTFRGTRQTDTVALQILTMNQRMASEADLQLSSMAPEGYVLMEDNFWVKGLGGDTIGLQENEYVSMEAQFYRLDSTLLTTHQANTQVGKVDDIQAIVYVLPKMRRDMHISMLVPWYLAFGSAGNQEVQPYENIRVELTIK